MPTGVNSANCRIRVTYRDAAGNSAFAASASDFVVDNNAPALTLNGGSFPNGTTVAAGGTTQTVSWTASDANFDVAPIELQYTLDGGASWTSIATVANTGTYNWTVPTVDSTQAALRLIASDKAGFRTQVTSSAFAIDTSAPTLVASRMSLNSGGASTASNVVQVSLKAQDLASNITHFCLKSTTGLSAPGAPAIGDSCWTAVNAPSPGLTPSQTLDLSGYYFTLGFTVGNYSVYAWARDAVGHISSLSNSGNGTAGLDKASIYYDISEEHTSELQSPEAILYAGLCLKKNRTTVIPRQ